MGVIGDIQTAIQGHLWIIQNSKLHAKRVESVRALIDLENFIRNDEKLAASTLPAYAHNALKQAQSVFKEDTEGETTLDICSAGAMFLFGLSLVSYCIHSIA
jgi:hypothetical protein